MSFNNAKIVEVDADQSLYRLEGFHRGDPQFCMSVSALKEFSRCPSRWKAGYVSPASTALAWGSVLDTSVLTPHRFNERFIVKPETYPAPAKHPTASEGDPLKWTGNAKYCKDWESQAAASGKELLSAEWAVNVDAATGVMSKDEILSAFIRASEKQVWLSAEWHDKETGLVIPVKALLDLAPKVDSDFGKFLGDLKTVKSAGHRAFQQAVFTYGWAVQAAFYLDLYCAATGEDRNTWVFAVQESFHPWQTARRILSQDFLDAGRESYRNSLADYCRCLKSGEWAGYDDGADSLSGWSLIHADSYMLDSLTRKTKHAEDDAEDAPPVDDIGVTP